MTDIFIHGLGQDGSSWTEVTSYLPETPEIECPDLFPLIAKGPATYQNLYQAFVAYCHQQPGKLNLCGLSLGGVLALNYTLDFPTKVNSLVLIGAQFKLPEKLLKLQALAFRLLPKTMFAEIGLSKNAAIQLMGSMTQLDFEKGLPQITCPTLVVCGAKDKANQKAARLLAEKIPVSTLSLIEGAGHEVNRDEPRRLAEMLNLFYQKIG